MLNNDVLRSLRFLLRASDAQMAEIAELGGLKIPAFELSLLARKEEEEGFRLCPDLVLAHVLNGMVVWKRGKDESRPAPPLDLPISNSAVLKKVRVAFSLQDVDIVRLIEKSGHRVSKAEVGAFLRRRDHRNFRECGDQFLRNLLRGLAP